MPAKMVNARHIQDCRKEHDPTTNFLAIDTETTGTNDRDGCCPFIVSACDNNGQTYLWEFSVDLKTRRVDYLKTQLDEIHQVTTQYHNLVFHNSRFDIRMLRAMGISLQPRSKRLYDEDTFATDNSIWSRFHDTLPLSHVLDSQESHGLKDLSAKYLNDYNDDEQDLQSATNEARRYAKSHLNYPLTSATNSDYWLPRYIALIDNNYSHWEDLASNYAMRDAIRTAKLFIALYSACESEQLLPYYRRERKILQITYHLEQRGATLHPQRHKDHLQFLSQKALEFKTGAKRIAKRYMQPRDLNTNSTKQLGAFLFETLKLKPTAYSEKTGEPSTNKDSLDTLLERLKAKSTHTKTESDAIQFLDQLLNNRRYRTATTYVKGYDDRTYLLPRKNKKHPGIYAHFNPNGTVSTRFSSSDPNLQNVGKRDSELQLRQVFGPVDPYYWVAMDYNQLELRIFAEVSGDRTMRNAFKKDQDVHQITADTLKIPRSGGARSGKHINFAWLYGASDNKLSAMADLDASVFSRQMRQTYPHAVLFMESVIEYVRYHGHINTRFGYKLSVPENQGYIGVNAIVQGTAGDIMKNAMILIHDYLNTNDLYEYVRPIINVHDEYVFEVRKDTPIRVLFHLKNLMETSGEMIGIRTPVEVTSFPEHWGQGEPVKFDSKLQREKNGKAFEPKLYVALFKKQIGQFKLHHVN